MMYCLWRSEAAWDGDDRRSSRQACPVTVCLPDCAAPPSWRLSPLQRACVFQELACSWD
jgi:hypothetical protein